MNQHFKNSPFFSVVIIVILACLTALLSQANAQVIIDEQFNGNAVDTSTFTFDSGNTIFGRVRLNSNPPPVQNGTLRLRLQSFNPIDTGDLFFADEIRTIQTFAPTADFGFSFETRARFVDDANNPLPPGVIGGIFLFGLDANFPNPNERDEIDFELLSNNPMNSISTNIFNDDGFNVSGNFMVTPVPGLDLTEFNDYRIEWHIDSIQFFVNDQLIREDTTDLALEPQDFRLNINAQGPEFPAAFSSLIQPTANPADNQIVIMEVDSLVITQLQINPTTTTTSTTVLADFTTSTTAQDFEGFDGLGTLTNNGYEIILAAADNNFGLVAEFDGNLVTQGVVVDPSTQLLVEATIGPTNDTDLVVAVREANGEFFSVAVPAADLADDGQAVVNLSDFFYNGDGVDGIPNGPIIEVSFQSPFGSGNAVDFTLQRISVITEIPVLLGDVDMNGTVSFSDIPPFIALLQTGAFQAEADVDLNGVVNFADIPPFIGKHLACQPFETAKTASLKHTPPG